MIPPSVIRDVIEKCCDGVERRAFEFNVCLDLLSVRIRFTPNEIVHLVRHVRGA